MQKKIYSDIQTKFFNEQNIYVFTDKNTVGVISMTTACPKLIPTQKQGKKLQNIRGKGAQKLRVSKCYLPYFSFIQDTFFLM